MRPEVWSGPWPSWPCGSSSTTSDVLAPLGLAGGDVLVDDRLGAVDEVAELRLPQHQRVRVGDRVAVLEAERGELRQRRVVDQEPLLVGATGAAAGRTPRRSCGRSAPSGAARTCRAGCPARTGGPACPPSPATRARAARANAQSMPPSRDILSRCSSTGFTRGCTVNPSGRLDVRVADPVERPRAAPRCPGPAGTGCSSSTDGLTARRRAFSSSRTSLNTCSSWLVKSLQGVLGLLDGDVAAADQRLGVDLPDAALGVDDVVHRGLGHRGVVALVVPAAAVADHVDHDVVVPALPVLHGQLGHPDAGLGVVAVHVEDRRADHLRDVGAVLRLREASGAVVNPTWLLMTTCTVPPVR